ncbi:MAG: hypothetical protein JKY48_14775 [Flavobacteriales bacterium]|nr:hypothetical protein [Flavobacteriales bacterium]
MKTKQLIALSIIGLTLFACEKDKDDTPTPASSNSTQSTDNTISFTGADGTVIAVKSLSDVGIATITIGTAIGVFYDNGSLVDVGTVSAEAIDLTKNANNNYTASASATSPTGISYTDPITWSVSGANGFSSFSENITRGFPTANAVNSPGIVDKSDGYTLSNTAISNSDSVLFSIGNVTKTMSANTTSCTFSSAELSGLANGSNFASIAPYNYSNKMISSKNIYFVNEYLVQKMVSVQN